MKFSELIHQNKPVLVDFFAEWCGPCKMQAPILQELKQNMGDAVSIIKIDVDKNPKVAAQYQIRSVPTMMIFKDGQAVWRESGVFPASQLEKLILQHS